MIFDENLILGYPLNLKEDEKYEFKEFCLEKFTSCNSYDEAEVIKIISKGLFDNKLNNLIKINLLSYLKKYIPKYYCSFCNSNLKSKLLIGVNDVGEITGIPLFKVSVNEIKNFIKENILKNIKGDNISIDDFNIKIIKLKKDKDIVYNISNNLLNDYIQHKKNKQKLFNNYNNKYKEWHTELQIKSGKLIRILKDKNEKKNFINYLIENNVNISIINFIKNNYKFDIPRGEEMQIRKKNKNDYIHWLTQFKDKQQKDIIELKPIKPYYKMCIDPFIILDKLTDMRYNFIDNKKINYYLIIIEINGINKTCPLFYYKKGKLIYRKRIGNECL